MNDLIQIGYLVAAALFILGLKGLSRPRTAVRGNLLSAAAMLIAVVVTLLDRAILSFGVIVAGLIVGSAIGAVLAQRVRMTGMPELVALFNGVGGGASVLVAIASMLESGPDQSIEFVVSVAAAVFIGAVTFTGSIVAMSKLAERFHWSGFAGVRLVAGAMTAVVAVVGIFLLIDTDLEWPVWVILAVGSIIGVLAVVPIGGADMPVVIAFLNSLSGLAAVAAGFALGNSLLIIAGSLVGASGILLTHIMCVAMNRTFFEVLFGNLAPAAGGPSADDVYGGRVRSASADDVAMILDTAERVSIVPGYGMAVSQAQHAVRDLTNALENRGAEVMFAIHPVAGRMPGHMNVLLAEAEIPYEQLLEMDVANPQFPQIDVAIVLGANDVVNPSARTDPDSPIAGMPILDVDLARTVVVIKRSLSPGFAGIPNPLFAADNTLMLFADGKQAVVDITKALAEL